MHLVFSILRSKLVYHIYIQLAMFPGLPTVQFLIACSAIKDWMVGRPGNEANLQLQSVYGK